MLVFRFLYWNYNLGTRLVLSMIVAAMRYLQ